MFMEALAEVTSMTRTKFEIICKSLYLMTKQLSQLAFRNVALKREMEARKNIEEELRLSRNLYRGVFENTGAATMIIEEDTTISLVNKRFTELFEYTREEVEGRKSWTEFVSEEDLEKMKEYHTRRRDPKASVPARYQFGIIDKSGSRRDGYVTVGMIPGTKKSVASAFDITTMKLAEEERRKIEAQMLNAQKLESLGILAGGIAHDFNNMLMVILGNADLAMTSISAGTQTHSRLLEIEKVARQAADLSNQMLAYSGRGKFVIEPINMNEIIHEMAQMLSVTVSKNTVIRYKLVNNLCSIQGDLSQFRQVILNLVANASDAIGEEPGLLTVSTSTLGRGQIEKLGNLIDGDLSAEKCVLLEVTDTGCGMDEMMISRIFDPFFTTKSTGRGLGMAVVLGIVRGHNGKIKVESQPGKGSRFRLFFPVTEDENIYLEKKSPVTGNLPELVFDGTVLLVDDEEGVRNVTGEMLKCIGFDVLTASGGHEALEILKENRQRINCVMLDLTMPGISGEETYRRMRKIVPDLKVIIASGYDEEDVSHRTIMNGLAGFIQKPYDIKTLSEKLREVLEKP